MRHAQHTPAPTGRRRSSNTGLYVLGGAVVVLAGLGGVLAGLNSERRDIRPAAHAPAAFDLPQVSAQAEARIAEAAKAPPPPLSASPQPVPAKPSMSVVLPLPYDGSAATRSRPGGPGKVPVVTAKAVRWVRTHKVFAAFLKAPARYLAGKGGRMRSPGAFQAFLADKKQVDAFLDSPLVRVALNSPVISRALLGDPAVTKAFLGSPAMQDKATVSQFLKSPLFQKVIDCPGPQGAIEDGRTLPAVLTSPAVVGWIRENPGALDALREAVPALAAMNPGLAPKKR